MVVESPYDFVEVAGQIVNKKQINGIRFIKDGDKSKIFLDVKDLVYKVFEGSIMDMEEIHNDILKQFCGRSRVENAISAKVLEWNAGIDSRLNCFERVSE